MNKPRRAHRLLLAAAVCLFAGTVVSVAVAVAFALWGTVGIAPFFRGREWLIEGETAGLWAWALDRLPPRGAATEFFASASGISDAELEVLPRAPFDGPRNRAWLHQTGWPMRALQYRHIQDLAGADRWPGDPTGWQPPPWLIRSTYYAGIRGNRPPVPLRPITLGIVLDSALFGGLLFAAFAMLGPGRRALRRWRSLCPSCGYSRAGLGADAVCPECGRGRAA
jgi:hypothetical protein